MPSTTEDEVVIINANIKVIEENLFRNFFFWNVMSIDYINNAKFQFRIKRDTSYLYSSNI